LRRRRFLLMRSSGGADLSANDSIFLAAIRTALAAWVRRRFLIEGFFKRVLPGTLKGKGHPLRVATFLWNDKTINRCSAERASPSRWHDG
jgi:hypothetical protein